MVVPYAISRFWLSVDGADGWSRRTKFSTWSTRFEGDMSGYTPTLSGAAGAATFGVRTS